MFYKFGRNGNMLPLTQFMFFFKCNQLHLLLSIIVALTCTHVLISSMRGRMDSFIEKGTIDLTIVMPKKIFTDTFHNKLPVFTYVFNGIRGRLKKKVERTSLNS